MYESHANFIVDKTKNLPFWRYMDFYKFISLINTSKLYFPVVEVLGDQHEGKIPEKIFKMMFKDDEESAIIYKQGIGRLRKETFVSSWTASEKECFAMWKMYAKEKLGIAIKTNFEKLKEAFKNEKETIYIGEVVYYNNNKPKYQIGNTFTTILTKHNYYEFESEVRCITMIYENEKYYFKNIEVDLNTLIEEVYISPFAYESGIIDTIEFLKIKKSLKFDIKISGVNDNWI